MSLSQMKSIIEGLLFVAGEDGLSVRQLAEVLELDHHQVTALLSQLAEQLQETGRGIQIVELAGTYQLATLPTHAAYLEKLAYSPSRTSLSQAALETLSIIAYRQPITRVAIEEIRGVKSDRALHRLVAYDLIEEVGRADAIGRPILYGTTKKFLDGFGLNHLQDLPDAETFAAELQMDAEALMLFDKLEAEQLSFEDLPEVPAMPNMPDLPEVPDMPDALDISDMPDIPDEPEDPFEA